MKPIRFTLFTIFMSSIMSLGAWATNPESLEKDSYGRVIQTDSMFFWKEDPVYSFDRWFISVGGGVGRLIAEDSRKLPFWKESKPMWTVSAGAWITPAWGIRVNAAGGSLQGFALWNEEAGGGPGYGGGNWFFGYNYPNPIGRDKFNSYLEAAFDADPAIREFIKNNYLDTDKPRVGKDGSKGYNYHFSYYSVMADLMLNVNNALWGYSGRDDFFQVIPFGGLGWAHTSKDGMLPRINHIAVRGGLMADVRLTDRLRFGVESYVMLVPEVFDRFVGGNRTQDAVFSLTAGLTYKFGKTKPKRCITRYYKYHMPAPVVSEPKAVVSECPGVQISGLVYDAYGNPVGNATVFIYDTRAQNVKVLRSGESGFYTAVVPCDAPLVIKVAKSGYLEDCLSLVVPTNNSIGIIPHEVPLLRLEHLEKDKIIRLNNIHYDFDKWNIRPDAAVELDKVVSFLQNNPYISVELGSHTDSRGTHEHNDNLSQKRAVAAVTYITASGISPDRITATWYGERQLLENCPDGVQCTEEQHQINRRTEIKIVDKGSHLPQTDDPWAKYIAGKIYKPDELPAGFFDKCELR